MTAAVEAGARLVRTVFHDRGCGIPAGVVEKVFHPFFTTKPSGEGTGLGLSIVHGIVAAHGGAIRCESVEGDHTRITVDLPALPATGDPAGGGGAEAGS